MQNNSKVDKQQEGGYKEKAVDIYMYMRMQFWNGETFGLLKNHEVKCIAI